jgi:serine/threonine protein kinase
MERKPGAEILHYTLLEKLGAGGMGEIYKAQDKRLSRFVAIKVLPPNQISNPEMQRRFIQEAQAASALNHPNIITIYDILDEGDSQYIVMEYVAGETLLKAIPPGGLRVPQVLRYATQIADALTVAHAAGIIHRDLKPANVMVTGSGLVKLLDFGLAKWTGNAAANSAVAGTTVTGTYSGDQATLTQSPLTVEGSILGTLNYMSPEQAEGKRVDARSDIFSFGAVLYEMATGRRAFEGDSAVSTLSAVLRDEVTPIATLAPDVPRELDEIISRCLQKNPDERWQSMKDVEGALNSLKKKSDSGILYNPGAARSAGKGPGIFASKQAKGVVLAGAGVVLLAAGVSGWWWTSHRQAASKPVQQAATPVAVRPAPVTPPPTPVPSPAAATPVPAAPAPAATPTAAPAKDESSTAAARPSRRETAKNDSVLTNDSIIEMTRAKVPTVVILGQIRSSKTKFRLSTQEVIRLAKAGVAGTVVEAMRNPKRAAALEAAASQPAPSAPVPPPATPATQNNSAAATAAPAPAPAKPAPIVKQVPVISVKINDALPFRIILTDDVPANAPEGTSVSFRVPDGLTVEGTTVIAKGAAVSGEVMGEVAKKKFLGIGGGSKLNFRLLFASGVDNAKIRVRATAALKGNESPSRPFDTGKGSKSKELAAARGAEYIAYIDGDQTISIHKAGQ